MVAPRHFAGLWRPPGRRNAPRRPSVWQNWRSESRRRFRRLTGDMRNLTSPSVLLGAALLAVAAPAYADDVAGSYDVKFEQVSTNCEHPLAYPQHGTLKIEIKGGDLQVDIDRTPIMLGKSAKPGKISAKSPKPGHTPVEGMDGVFSVAGRITTEGM